MAFLYFAMGFLALFGVGAFLAARARRNASPAVLRADGRTLAAPASPASAPADPNEKAWVSRITQSIPTVVKRLSDSEPPRSAERTGLGLQGNLAQTPLHDLMQYLALGRKSGVLELASGRRTGRIVMAEGRILKSAYRGKEGMEAAFLMLDLSDGDFEFYEQAKPEASSQPPLEVVDAIMLWMARKPKKKPATQG